MPEETIHVRDLRSHEWLWTSKTALFHSRIDGNTFKVYCGLASYANNSTQKAFPSIDTLAAKLNMGRSTVIRAIAKLEAKDLKFIKIIKNEGQHNIYMLLDIEEEINPKKHKGADYGKENWVKEMLEWAEKKKGSKFVTYGKQIGSIGAMHSQGYSIEEIKGCYELMEKSDFWRPKGFDFKNVADELPKKITSLRKSNGASQFDHLTKR